MNTISDILIIDKKGPWKTKSDAELSVLMTLDSDTLNKSFFDYDPAELAKIPVDIKGLRIYSVDGLARSAIGANEWHRVRNELVFALNGLVKWTMKDMHGQTKEITIGADKCILIPNHILHTYEALEDDTRIMVLANTIFIPEDSATHDTYSIDEFLSISSQIKE